MSPTACGKRHPVPGGGDGNREAQFPGGLQRFDQAMERSYIQAHPQRYIQAHPQRAVVPCRTDHRCDHGPGRAAIARPDSQASCTG